MTKEPSLVVKRRDYSNITKFSDPLILEEFMDEPATFIAETLTGILGEGAKGVYASGGRIVQAILKGRAYKQWAVELKRLRASGRIADDFAERKFGFQTWVELMTIIDEDSPDEDRLEALKAMFYAVNRVDASEGDQVAAYFLWQIAKSLSSGELFLLKVAYETRETYPPDSDYRNWAQMMARLSGHSLIGLISLHEKKLTELGLLSERQYGDGSGINSKDARLTDFGIRFCENIETYRLDMGKSDGV